MWAYRADVDCQGWRTVTDPTGLVSVKTGLNGRGRWAIQPCKVGYSRGIYNRNGYKEKTVNSSYGSMRIDVPQDRKSTFEPKVVKKRQKDISDIDQKIIHVCQGDDHPPDL